MFKINKTMLLQPNKLTWPFGWCEHIPFIGWLVEAQRPGNIVDLGVYSGNFYFAMCQSVLENNLDATCYAIGSWTHDGLDCDASQAICHEFSTYNQANYSSFSKVLYMENKEITEHFSQHNIDLLHINAERIFAAGSDELEQWLSKMSTRGIVIIDDINTHDPKKKMWRLWDMLSQRYPHFNFKHADGLGILFVGEESHGIFNDNFNSADQRELIENLFSRLGVLVAICATGEYSSNLSEQYITEFQNKINNFSESLTKYSESLVSPNAYIGENIKFLKSHDQFTGENDISSAAIEHANHLATSTEHPFVFENHSTAVDEKKITEIQILYEQKLNQIYAEHQETFKNLVRQQENQALLLAEKQLQLNKLLHSRSWRITKPTRFVFRIMRGQYSIAFQPVKVIFREKLKKLYYRTPPRYRTKLLHVGFKLRPSWFQNHPQFLRKDAGHFAQQPSSQSLLVDMNRLSDDYAGAPCRVAVHCHIFYHDLIDEFRQHLSTVPFDIDVFVSVATAEAREVCQRELKKVANIGKLEVVLVPNRGRDLAPMFAQFGNKLKTYDYIGHIQSKKSLYNGGSTLGWREYLLDALFGSTSNVKRIFKLFNENENLGIIYPQAFSQIPYAAFTWLANSSEGSRLCARMAIAMPASYFNFPAGSMFWARMDAMRPLFDLNLSWNDFPEEHGQTDGTTAHALERMLGIVPTATGYETLIIKDMQTPSWSPFRIDHQYLPRRRQTYFQYMEEDSTAVIAFDIFDTLLVRPLVNPDHTKKMVATKLSSQEKSAYEEFRAQAEDFARNKLGKDVGLDEIYAEFASLSGLPTDNIQKIRQLEVSVESASVSVRKEVAELLPRAKQAGKRVVLISDIFMDKDIINAMLTKNGIVDWDKLYLSSDRGERKDTGKLYEIMLKEEGVEGKQVLMIGDNERSDLQLPSDAYGIRCFPIFSAVSLARCLPAYAAYIEPAKVFSDLSNELSVGLLLRENLNKIADFTASDINIFGEDSHKIGFNLTGPITLAFCHWLILQAKADNIERLYFLSREGKLIKQVYDAWTASIPDAPKSYYLQVSRRTVNVPSIVSFQDVKKISEFDYFENKIESFLYERFGLELTQESWQEIYAKGLWQKGKLLEVFKKDIKHLEPLLQFLLPDILREAKTEKNALLNYLNNCDFMSEGQLALVDVGYSGTIQKSLNRIAANTVHGYYFATANNVRDGMAPLAITRGCYVDNAEPCFDRSHIFSDSFSLEKLLSADDPQMVKYIKKENGELECKFKVLREGELATRPTRHELQSGCMSYVNQAVYIREKLYQDFVPSLDISNSLYSDFILKQREFNYPVLGKLVLDDDYCGRGLIN